MAGSACTSPIDVDSILQTITDTSHSAYFAQYHVDTLTPTMTPVSFLASKFPGKSEQEYRGHLGNFQISGMTGLQLIGTLSGGQKSRVAFAALSLQNPHILLLDEVSALVYFASQSRSEGFMRLER